MEELDRGYKMLLELEDNQTFRQWRDEAEAAFLTEIEQAKATALTLDEANLKALILYESKIKGLFNAFKAAVQERREDNKKVT